MSTAMCFFILEYSDHINPLPARAAYIRVFIFY